MGTILLNQRWTQIHTIRPLARQMHNSWLTKLLLGTDILRWYLPPIAPHPPSSYAYAHEQP